jgi:hypothetical protein
MAERLHVLDWSAKARDTVFESSGPRPWELEGRCSLPPADAPPPITVPCRLAGTARKITPDELTAIQSALGNGMSAALVAAAFERNVQSIAKIRRSMLSAAAVVAVG